MKKIYKSRNLIIASKPSRKSRNRFLRKKTRKLNLRKNFWPEKQNNLNQAWIKKKWKYRIYFGKTQDSKKSSIKQKKLFRCSRMRL